MKFSGRILRNLLASLLLLFLIFPAFGSADADIFSSLPTKDLRGYHWGNFKYLDPFGIIKNKSPVKSGISDREIFKSMLDKIYLGEAQSVKIIIYSYFGEEDRYKWLEVQGKIIQEIHRTVPRASLIFRLDEKPFINDDPARGILMAPVFAQDFSWIVNSIVDEAQDDSGEPPIWLIIGNEPNHPGEGFNGDPNYFNAWFKTVVWHFWNQYPVRSKNGSRLLIFYPGLSQWFNDAGWYSHPSTQEILHQTIADPENPSRNLQQAWADGVALHTYWWAGQAKDFDAGERYKYLWKDIIAPMNPALFVIIGEWGSPISPADPSQEAVRSVEYRGWLLDIGNQDVVANILASTLFIIDGTDDWSAFIPRYTLFEILGGLF